MLSSTAAVVEDSQKLPLKKIGPNNRGAVLAQSCSLAAAKGVSSLLYSSRMLARLTAEIWVEVLASGVSAVSMASPIWSIDTWGSSSLMASRSWVRDPTASSTCPCSIDNVQSSDLVILEHWLAIIIMSKNGIFVSLFCGIV